MSTLYSFLILDSLGGGGDRQVSLDTAHSLLPGWSVSLNVPHDEGANLFELVCVSGVPLPAVYERGGQASVHRGRSQPG